MCRVKTAAGLCNIFNESVEGLYAPDARFVLKKNARNIKYKYFNIKCSPSFHPWMNSNSSKDEGRARMHVEPI